jgi:hypothetical protein
MSYQDLAGSRPLFDYEWGFILGLEESDIIAEVSKMDF